MQQPDTFWDFYWDTRLQFLQGQGKGQPSPQPRNGSASWQPNLIKT